MLQMIQINRNFFISLGPADLIYYLPYSLSPEDPYILRKILNSQLKDQRLLSNISAIEISLKSYVEKHLHHLQFFNTDCHIYACLFICKSNISIILFRSTLY